MLQGFRHHCSSAKCMTILGRIGVFFETSPRIFIEIASADLGGRSSPSLAFRPGYQHRTHCFPGGSKFTKQDTS